MEVVNNNVAFLSNFEVYTLLKQTKEDQAQKLLRKKIKKNSTQSSASLDQEQQQSLLASLNIDKHLPTIVYESLRYLETTPCIDQTSETISSFLDKCKERENEFKLTKTEKLQLINLRPASAVELQVIIEDAEERFTVEQIDSLLDFIEENLPSKSSVVPADSADQETVSS